MLLLLVTRQRTPAHKPRLLPLLNARHRTTAHIQLIRIPDGDRLLQLIAQCRTANRKSGLLWCCLLFLYCTTARIQLVHVPSIRRATCTAASATHGGPPLDRHDACMVCRGMRPSVSARTSTAAEDAVARASNRSPRHRHNPCVVGRGMAPSISGTPLDWCAVLWLLMLLLFHGGRIVILLSQFIHPP